MHICLFCTLLQAYVNDLLGYVLIHQITSSFAVGCIAVIHARIGFHCLNSCGSALITVNPAQCGGNRAEHSTFLISSKTLAVIINVKDNYNCLGAKRKTFFFFSSIFESSVEREILMSCIWYPECGTHTSTHDMFDQTGQSRSTLFFVFGLIFG